MKKTIMYKRKKQERQSYCFNSFFVKFKQAIYFEFNIRYPLIIKNNGRDTLNTGLRRSAAMLSFLLLNGGDTCINTTRIEHVIRNKSIDIFLFIL